MVILTPDYNNQLLWASEYNPSNAYIDMVILTSDEDMTALPPPAPPGRQAYTVYGPSNWWVHLSGSTHVPFGNY